MDFGLNLDTYGVKWNLDHVIPVSAVKERKVDLTLVWKLYNIKPMLIAENVKKGSFYSYNGNESTLNGSFSEEEKKNMFGSH